MSRERTGVAGRCGDKIGLTINKRGQGGGGAEEGQGRGGG